MEKWNDFESDLLDSPPPNSLMVKYSAEIVVEQGNILMPSQVKGRPIEVQWPAESACLYTLLFLDVDAPSRKKSIFRSVLHWLVMNIPNNSIDQGDTIAEFIGSGPGRDTGLHRYVMLVYKQPQRIEAKMDKITNRSLEGRPKFQLMDFVKEHNLELVAGNFYKCEFDDYTIKLYKQLGVNN